MIVSFFCVVGLVIILFIEYYLSMKFATKLSIEDRSFSLSNRKIKDAHEAFTKGNHLSKYLNKSDDRLMVAVIKTRQVLTLVFIISFFL